MNRRNRSVHVTRYVRSVPIPRFVGFENSEMDGKRGQKLAPRLLPKGISKMDSKEGTKISLKVGIKISIKSLDAE